MATQGGPAKAVSVQTGGRQQGGAAIPVAVVTDGRAVEGGPAMAVYQVTSGPVQGGPAVPIVVASGAQASRVAAGPAVPVFVVSGSLGGSPPVNIGLPAISGVLAVGQVLSTTDGTWTNSPTSYGYQWKRDGANIGGATANTYTLTASDPGTTITVTITATNAAGNASATSTGVAISSLLTSLVAGWKYEEASGNRLDVLGISPLVPTNAPGNVAGVVGNAVQFVGASSQLLAAANNASLQMGDIDFSIRIWWRPQILGSMDVLAKWTSIDPNREYSIYYDNAAHLLNFAVSSTGTNAGRTIATFALTIVANTWYFVKAQHDAALNKIAVAADASAFSPVTHNGGVWVTTNSLIIGGNQIGFGFKSQDVDEGYIWKRLLTPAEDVYLFNGGSGRTYPFDGVPALAMDAFVVAGQSNASGRGTNNQSYTGAVGKGLLFGNDYTIRAMVDPSDSNTGQVDVVSSDGLAAGSVWPLVASSAVGANGRYQLFIPCSLGGTSITQWQPGINHQDRTTLYGSMIYRALQAQANGATLRCVLWWQGETDAINGMSQSTYNTNLVSLANAIFADLGIKVMPCKLQTFSAATQPQQDAINAAITANWGAGNVLSGPDLTGISTLPEDSVHVITDAKLAATAALWWAALQAVI